MSIIKAIILGIIEGFTEWLPISSTGHMILAEEFMGLHKVPEFMEMFRVVIQLGAIMAVLVLFWGKLFPFSFAKGLSVKKDTFLLWVKVLIATLPAASIGLLFDDILDEKFYNPTVVAFMLILYGIVFIIVENQNKKRKPLVKSFDRLGYKMVLAIGAFQVLALIPGTSRSGATILGAIMIGCSREIAAEFSFYLAIPVMFGASFLKLLKFGFAFTHEEAILLGMGMFIAFVVSIFAIKFLMGYIKRNNFKAFGYYRIVLGLIMLMYVFYGSKIF